MNKIEQDCPIPGNCADLKTKASKKGVIVLYVIVCVLSVCFLVFWGTCFSGIREVKATMETIEKDRITLRQFEKILNDRLKHFAIKERDGEI